MVKITQIEPKSVLFASEQKLRKALIQIVLIIEITTFTWKKIKGTWVLFTDKLLWKNRTWKKTVA